MSTAGVTQLVECQPSKLNVASSNLVSRSSIDAYIAQSVEHFLGKEEVTSSSLVVGFGRYRFALGRRSSSAVRILNREAIRSMGIGVLEQ